MFKRRINKFVILLGCLCVVLVALFLYRYQELNAPGKQFKVHNENINKNDYIESSDVLLSFQSMKRKVTYDSDFKSDVYQYKITFTAKNISITTINLNERMIPHIVLVSAKQKYYADPIDDSALKSNASVTKNAYINVVKEDSVSADLYKSYKLYFIVNASNDAFIYHLKLS